VFDDPEILLASSLVYYIFRRLMGQMSELIRDTFHFLFRLHRRRYKV